MTELDPNEYVVAAGRKGYLALPQTVDTLIKAMIASKNSYSPYSKFPVGAAVVTKQGLIFSGCNVENASYGITLCAERAAIANMVTTLGPKAKIRSVIIYTPTLEPSAPCGACRQVIREFAEDLFNTKVISFSASPYVKPMSLTVDQLLPYSFNL